jgi:DNA-binding LacI/PurR family transcriptional regulator
VVAAKRPTIRDVAEAAGVSKSLAAMVFSAEGGVSADRREKVLDAAKKLGYTPNQWARSLRSGAGSFVGILLNDLHNPLLIEIADLTRKILLDKGQQSLISAAVITEKNGKRIVDPASIHSLLDLKPKALVIVGGLPDLKPFRQIPETIPVIVASSQASSLPNATIVRADDEQALRLLVAHLIELGHQNIGYVGPVDSENSIARRDAYVASMKLFGLEKFTVTQVADRFEDRGYAAAKLLLQGSNPPTAIIGFNDNIAFGIQSAVQELVSAGRPPVAVTGFDNTFVSALSLVSLTSIEQEKEAIAMKIAEILTEPQGSEGYRGQEFKLMPRLIARRSTFRL